MTERYPEGFVYEERKGRDGLPSTSFSTCLWTMLWMLWGQVKQTWGRPVG